WLSLLPVAEPVAPSVSYGLVTQKRRYAEVQNVCVFVENKLSCPCSCVLFVAWRCIEVTRVNCHQRFLLSCKLYNIHSKMISNGKLTSNCIRFAAVAMVLFALLVTIPPCSGRPAIEGDESADGKIVNQSANINQPRSSILDNIFNIPIQTLKAVNDLVQSIAGNLQQAGSGTYFRARSSNVRNINVNVDEEDENEDGKKKKLDEKN
uniref:Uncharacterized protein n=1 Tax=Anopheles christyi TaxID=43041 RepID=A0A182KAU2_9DIPT